jgi:hypothetical protein
MNPIKYLNQSFPKAENKWKVILFISLFVSLFLIIFQPFGISLITGNAKFLFLAGYGIITFLILIIDLIFIEKFFPKFFNERNWKIWKEFFWLLWVIFSIGLGNAFYTAMVFDNTSPNIKGIINFQIVTIVVALIPITILIISKQKYLLRKHLNSADFLNKNLHEKPESIQTNTIRFYADNEKDFVEFDINDFLYIESSGNYVELYILDSGKIIRKTIRNTLKRSLYFFTNTPEIIQCHRAFIVNTNKITNAKGNSQGLRLSLENCETEVPVSRGFVNAIKILLSK